MKLLLNHAGPLLIAKWKIGVYAKCEKLIKTKIYRHILALHETLLSPRARQRGTHVSCAANSCLCYLFIFIYGPVGNQSSQLCILSRTTETTVISLTGFRTPNTHLECRK